MGIMLSLPVNGVCVVALVVCFFFYCTDSVSRMPKRCSAETSTRRRCTKRPQNGQPVCFIQQIGG
jgi:hypothetical protein